MNNCNFTDLNYIKYKIGTNNVLIEAIHNVFPIKYFFHPNKVWFNKFGTINTFKVCNYSQMTKGEFFTDTIALVIQKQTNCSIILAKLHKGEIDLNRPIDPQKPETKKAINEYRKTINTILKQQKSNNNFLHISLHGMKNKYNLDIEVGTRDGNLCKPEIKSWFIKELNSNLKQFKITVDTLFKGNEVLEQHIKGDKYGHKGFGKNYNIFQIELSKTLRTNNQVEIVNTFSKIINEFNKEFD